MFEVENLVNDLLMGKLCLKLYLKIIQMQLNYLPDFKYTMEKEKLRVFSYKKLTIFVS